MAGLYRNHHVADGKYNHSGCYNCFQFHAAGSGELPALLNMEEVTTLFHEFGHALDGLFNKNTYTTIPILHGILWNFLHRLMEHWATEPEVLNVYAKTL